MKKLLCTALIGMVIMSGGCGQGLKEAAKEGFKEGFDSTYQPKTVEEKSELVEETSEPVEEPQEKELEDIINGNEEYVFNRPNGDWGIRFKASIYQTSENGNIY